MRRTTIAAITTLATLAIGVGGGSAIALGSNSSSTPASTSLSPAAEAAEVVSKHDLRSLDALHLAAALLLEDPDLIIATWDRRLHGAARAEAIAVMPERLT